MTRRTPSATSPRRTGRSTTCPWSPRAGAGASPSSSSTSLAPQHVAGAVQQHVDRLLRDARLARQRGDRKDIMLHARQRLARLARRRDVHERPEPARRPVPRVAQQHAGHVRPAHDAVGRDEPDLDRELAVAVLAPARRSTRRRTPSTSSRMHRRAPAVADQRARLAPRQLARPSRWRTRSARPRRARRSRPAPGASACASGPPWRAAGPRRAPACGGARSRTGSPGRTAPTTAPGP